MANGDDTEREPPLLISTTATTATACIDHRGEHGSPRVAQTHSPASLIFSSGCLVIVTELQFYLQSKIKTSLNKS